MEVFRSSTDEMNNAATAASRGSFAPRDPAPFRSMGGPRGYDRWVFALSVIFLKLTLFYKLCLSLFRKVTFFGSQNYVFEIIFVNSWPHRCSFL